VSSVVTNSKKKLSIFIEIQSQPASINPMNTISHPDITNILNANVSYVLTTRDGELLFISEAAERTISYAKPIELGQAFHSCFKDQTICISLPNS
jgi:hypothetical protein